MRRSIIASFKWFACFVRFQASECSGIPTTSQSFVFIPPLTASQYTTILPTFVPWIVSYPSNLFPNSESPHFPLDCCPSQPIYLSIDRIEKYRTHGPTYGSTKQRTCTLVHWPCAPPRVQLQRRAGPRPSCDESQPHQLGFWPWYCGQCELICANGIQLMRPSFRSGKYGPPCYCTPPLQLVRSNVNRSPIVLTCKPYCLAVVTISMKTHFNLGIPNIMLTVLDIAGLH